jgi:hypothetical protein
VTMNVNAAHHSVDYLTVTLILLLIFGSPLILIFCACSENKDNFRKYGSLFVDEKGESCLSP